MTTIRRWAPYLLAILSLFAAGLHLVFAYRAFEPSADMVSPWEEHMKLLREALSSNVRMAGYVERADLPDSTTPFDPAEFFLTQYGLAPVVLVKGLDKEFIIGNFGGQVSPESIRPWLDQSLGTYSLQELGFGLYLIHDLED